MIAPASVPPLLRDLRREVLPSGLLLLAREDRRLPLVFLGIGLRRGAVEDPVGKEGALRLLLSLLKKGAGERDAEGIAADLESLGAALLERTTSEHALLGLEVLAERFEEALSLLADLVLRPTLSPTEVEKERRRLAAELRREEEDARLAASRKFERALFLTHPYGRTAAGTSEGVGACRREDLLALRSLFAPGNALLVLLGDLDERRLAAARETFGGWRDAVLPERDLPRPEPDGRRVVLSHRPGATQAQLRLGRISIARTHPAYFPLLVANTVLGGGFSSLLVDAVRVNRGLTYGISSRLDARRFGGAIAIETFTKNASVAETVEAACGELARLRSGFLPPGAVERAKRYLAGQWPFSVETAPALASALVSAEAVGIGAEGLASFVPSVHAVSEQGVRRALPLLPDPEDLLVFAEGEGKDIAPALERFGRLERFESSVREP
ncbi:MAG TPA: pitrilysin family protein [Planctomycetota bacterium]|nr:pitrilysin family protein [Planctomycetota bacterium]